MATGININLGTTLEIGSKFDSAAASRITKAALSKIPDKRKSRIQQTNYTYANVFSFHIAKWITYITHKIIPLSTFRNRTE